MKLHNLLLTAALFLTAGIASAETFKINDLPKTNPERTDYDWSISNYQGGEYNLSATVIRNDDQDGWVYTAYTGSQEWNLSVELTREDDLVMATGTYLVDYTISYDDDGNMTKGVYYFSLPVETYNADGVPFDDVIAVRVGTTADSLQNDNGLFYKVTPTEAKYLSYNKNEAGVPEAEFAFGQPLPTPVVTLLIALGLGAAFVMYRNRKQAMA